MNQATFHFSKKIISFPPQKAWKKILIAPFSLFTLTFTFKAKQVKKSWAPINHLLQHKWIMNISGNFHISSNCYNTNRIFNNVHVMEQSSLMSNQTRLHLRICNYRQLGKVLAPYPTHDRIGIGDRHLHRLVNRDVATHDKKMG